jgi:hypothetical protein
MRLVIYSDIESRPHIIPIQISVLLKVTFQHKGFEETRRLGLGNETEQVRSYLVRGFLID